MLLYLAFALALVFTEVNAKVLLSKKISVIDILECFCFPVIYVLVFISIIVNIFRVLDYFFKNVFYIYKAHRFVSNTSNLNTEQLKNYILSNCLEKHSLDVKFIE